MLTGRAFFVGYWSTVAVPIAVALFPLLAISLLITWETALVLVAIIALVAFFGFRYWSRHHQAGRYDDRYFREDPIQR